jgi:hypothetical protein
MTGPSLFGILHSKERNCVLQRKVSSGVVYPTGVAYSQMENVYLWSKKFITKLWDIAEK